MTMEAQRAVEALMGRLGVGRLGRNAILTTAGLGVRAVIQAGYLLVLSHWMGAKSYGLFAGSVAAAILVAPLSGWGIAIVLTKRVARNRGESSAVWMTTVLQTLITGSVLACFVMLGSSLLLADHVNFTPMLLLCIAELMALPLAQAATSMCLALDCGVLAALSMCLVPICRLLSVFVGLLLGLSGTPSHVACLHFMGSLIGVTIACKLVVSVDGLPRRVLRLPMRDTVREGTHYAIGTLVSTSYMEVDKVIMLQVLGATAAGTYTVAFRVMSVFALPVSALIGAALPRLFAQHGTPNGLRTLRTVTLSGLGYALLATLMAMVISPWMPFVFGSGFRASSHYLLMLAPWTVLYALHQAGATGLTAFNRQVSRVCVEGAGFACVVVLNLALYPHVGAAGAVWSLLAAEIFMASCCWWLLLKASKLMMLRGNS
jgi:O-antigen/teichoic acid export membrane protein